MSSYFWNGFQHVLVGLVFAAVYGRVARGLYLRRWSFWAGIIFTSGALFFVPLHIAAFGSFADWLYQFVHYPLADWDILFLGMSWHRFFLTHSFVIPILVWAAVLDFKKLHPLVFGMVIGHSSHLFWDAVTSAMSTPVVFWAQWLAIRGTTAKSWLLVNSAFLFWLALVRARKQTTF